MGFKIADIKLFDLKIKVTWLVTDSRPPWFPSILCFLLLSLLLVNDRHLLAFLPGSPVCVPCSYNTFAFPSCSFVFQAYTSLWNMMLPSVSRHQARLWLPGVPGWLA